jgi:hypothetical protein
VNRLENNDTNLELNVVDSSKKRKYGTKYLIILMVILGLAHSLDEYISIAPGMI